MASFNVDTLFPYDRIPPITDNDSQPLLARQPCWLTDTTLRDGQQARAPYSVDQAVKTFKLLNKLGGEQGMIRQTEVFIYSPRDIEVLQALRACNLKYPEITAWIRATKSDLELAKKYEFKEAGILTSASDLHIEKKLGWTREQAMQNYLDIVSATIDAGIQPRCHLEDITRADIMGFVKPYAQALFDLGKKRGVPIKVRLCDTLGFGIPYELASLPRSVQWLVNIFRNIGFTAEQLEWHGHNDFHKVFVNAATAWLSGCGVVNATLLGFGERTGNPPLEGLAIELAALRGSNEGMDLATITEIGDFFRDQLHYAVAENYPFVGEHFNTTRAGIHIDGTIKNECIYNIFDTKKILNRPPRIQITDRSGAAGVALWLEQHLKHTYEKKDPVVVRMAEKIMEEYRNGRATAFSDNELRRLYAMVSPAK